MKVIMAKGCSKEMEQEQAIMPNDFVDQLSKRKKPSFEHPCHLLLAVFLKDQKNTALQAKDIILALNNEPAKYFDQAKAILENIKARLFATVLRDEKEIKVPVIVSADGKLELE
jgi:regulator of sigma E protease